MVGGAILSVIVLAALTAPLIAPDSPLEQDATNVLGGPSSAHLLGTDTFGRDIFSRLLYGGRSALLEGVVSVALALTIGTVPRGHGRLPRGKARRRHHAQH